MIKKFLKYHPVHKKIATYLDAIFLLQPTLFFLVWVIPVLGMVSAQNVNNVQTLWHVDLSIDVFFVFFGITLLFASMFISNQLSLIIKSKSSSNFVLTNKYISIENAKVIAKNIFILGILVTAIGNIIVSIIFTLSIYTISNIIDNYVLLEWKKIPIINLLINSFIGISLFIMGWMLVVDGEFTDEIFYFVVNIKYIVPYLLFFLSIILMIILKDIKNEDDRNDSDKLSIYEFRVLLLLSLLLIIFSLFFSLKNIDPLGSTASIVSLPFFVFATFRQLYKDILRAIYYPIFIINFFSFAYYPWLFVPVFCTYYISKYYYWHRFSLDYPTFIVDND